MARLKRAAIPQRKLRRGIIPMTEVEGNRLEALRNRNAPRKSKFVEG